MIQKTYKSQLEIDSSTIISSLTEENQQMQEVLGIADGVCIDNDGDKDDDEDDEECTIKRDNATVRTLEKRHESLGGVEDVEYIIDRLEHIAIADAERLVRRFHRELVATPRITLLVEIQTFEA